MTVSGRKAAILVGALIASLCLNLFVAAAWTVREARGSAHRPAGHGIERLIRTAPPDVRAAIKPRFDAARPVIRDRIGEAIAARRELAALMRAPEVDPAALNEGFAKLRQKGDAVETLVQETLVEALAAMPAETRTRWADAWERRR